MSVVASAPFVANSILGLAKEILMAEHGRSISPTPALTTPFSNTSQADWAEAVRLWNEHGRKYLADLRKRSCPACEGAEARRLFDSYDGYPYVECVDCNCWYVPLRVEADLFERFFAACPEAGEVARRSFSRRLAEDSVAANLERIGRYLDMLLPMLPPGPHRRYLDAGCGLGDSLSAAQERGLAAVGLESSPQCIQLAREKGLDVRDSAGAPPHGPFDLISFWESLEHMADPAAQLLRCRELLATNGILAFTVPNQNSPLVRAQRADCSVVNGGCDTPGHINLFSPASMRTLLERCGFTLLGLDGQYGLSLPELLSYMFGATHGAADLLNGRPVSSGMSPTTSSITNAIGPAVTVLERVTLSSPILFGFACRHDAAPSFARAAELFEERKRSEVLAQISAMMG